MNDSGRSVNNPMAATLRWNNNAAEDTSSWYTGNIEFYSNGFKIIRDTTNDDSNRNNEGYLYMAWAEDALSGQFGATSNAR